MRKFKHIPTGEEWKLNGAGGILPVNNYTNYSLPLWITVNSKDWKEIIEKEWKIITLKYVRDNSDLITEEELIVLWLKGQNISSYSIHSVKRLSDGEVFTVGDNTSSGVIVSFDINSTIMNVVFGPNRHSICNSGFAKIKKEPLFTTEDGVEIFEGDTIFSVEHTYYKIDDKIAGIYKGSNKNHPVEHWYNSDKYFSTKEAAEEYILLNKPVLSINDFYSFSLCQAEEENTHNKLKALVKSRL